MNRYLFLLILCIGSGLNLFSQVIVSGIVTDAKSGQAISLVNLSTDQGRIGTTTNQDGKFSITVNRLPVTIRFSHVAFQTRSISIGISQDKFLKVQLEPKLESIPEVVIEGGRYIQILKRENFYVNDFEFDQNIIWVVGYANKSILKPLLIVTDLDGRLIEKMPVEGRTNLYKDAFGRVHLMDKNSIVTVELVDKRIRMGTPKAFTGWEQNLFDLQMVLGKSGIFKWEYNNGLYCEYAQVNFTDTVATIIHKAYDRGRFAGEGPAKTFRHGSIPDIPSAPWGFGYDPDASTPFVSRAQEQVDYKPIKTHIFRYRNSLLIFENRGCHLWKYDLKFVDPEHLRITEPDHAENIDLLQDQATGNLYLYYTIKGSDYLAAIDPATGATLFTRKLENYHSASKVKVYNGRAWFTHQNINGSALMNLYSTAIGEN